MIILSEADGDRAREYVENNIERVVKQCMGGDESMSFLAVYSFVEGFFRNKYHKELSFDKNVSFPVIIESVIEKECCNNIQKHKLYEQIMRYHGASKHKNVVEFDLETSTDTNRIRHCFSKISEGTIFVVIDQFIDFCKENNLLEDYPAIMSLVELRDKKYTILSDQDYSTVPMGSCLLLRKIEDVLDYANARERYLNEIESLNNILSCEIRYPELKLAVDKKVQVYKELKRLESDRSDLNDYISYVNGLYELLSEARSKKKFESRIIRLSKDQIDLINDSIYRKSMESPGRSMYLKGGPGTGKTLVLVASLLKMYKQCAARTCLLTFYPTLNKYIMYLFQLCNDSNLLWDNLSIEKIDRIALENLARQGIHKFDDFMTPKIVQALVRYGKIHDIEKKEVYSVKDRSEHVMDMICGVVSDRLLAKEIFYDITDVILPNGYEKAQYSIFSEKNEKKWVYIEQILDLLNSEDGAVLDLYLYYLFFTSDIPKDAFAAESYDYIIVDEAQDLNNAQIFAANKFVNNSGGLILAGDPSQEIRNKWISMSDLGVSLNESVRLQRELVKNYRSTKQIQELGNDYKDSACLSMVRDTQSVDGTVSGPLPQLYVTDDTPDSNYEDTYEQIVNSVRMCIEGLDIIPGNITIVSFCERELLNIRKRILEKLGIESVLIYNDYDFSDENEYADKVKLCTLENIKGIDCPVLIFMVTDQSLEENSGGISAVLKANAIYTCITRAMFFLQVFVPKYCIRSDISIAVLVHLLDPSDKELEEYVEEKNRKSSRIIPLMRYFDKKKDESLGGYIVRIKRKLLDYCFKAFGANDNIDPKIDIDGGYARIFQRKKVVKSVADGNHEISFDDARGLGFGADVGDEVDVYVDPSVLNMKKEAESYLAMNEGKIFAKELYDCYSAHPNNRIDSEGNPNITGYLNITFMDRKPSMYGYEYSNWPELINNHPEKFQFIKIPYPNGTPGYIFAYKPIKADGGVIGDFEKKGTTQNFVLPSKKRYTIWDAYEELKKIYNDYPEKRVDVKCNSAAYSNEGYLRLSELSNSQIKPLQAFDMKWSEIIRQASGLFECIELDSGSTTKELAYRIGAYRTKPEMQGLIESIGSDWRGNKYYVLRIGKFGKDKIKAFCNANENFNDFKVGDKVLFNLIFSNVKGKKLPSAINLRNVVDGE